MPDCVYCGKPCEPREGTLCPSCKDAVEHHTANNDVVVQAYVGSGWAGFRHLLERHREFTDWLTAQSGDDG